jgi:hypothetical protein
MYGWKMLIVLTYIVALKSCQNTIHLKTNLSRISCKFSLLITIGTSKLKISTLGANPTIVVCNASVVKIYNSTSSQVRFGTKLFSSILKKRSSLAQRWYCSCKFRSRSIGSR